VNLQPGVAVTPTIHLVRCLGQGGMGSVWIADHLALHTQVVVKFMAAQLVASGDAVERFSREAAAAAQVKSPHVVQMLDHGITPTGVPFIVMELLEGRDLAKHLAQRGGRLPLAEIADIVGQAAKALARAHERGIVHRDIKPENIFLCDVGSGELFVKILDFGIAKAAADSTLSGGTKTGATLGTPYYMSPEQMVGARTIDARADLWSLGVVVYQCVLGNRPFEAETFGALAVMIHTAQIPTPSCTDPTLPAAFDAWFLHACARDPAARFSSARELADALAAVARAAPWAPAATLPVAQSPFAGASVSGSASGPHGLPVHTTTQSVSLGPATGGRPTPATPLWLAVGAVAVIALAGGTLLTTRAYLSSRAAAARPPAVSAAPTPPAAPPPPAVVALPEPAAATTVAPPPAASSARAASPPTPATVPTKKSTAAVAPATPPTTTPTVTKKDERDIF
jgi:serine/threonine-protein kinase